MEKTVEAALLNLQALKAREHDLVDPQGSFNEARDILLTRLAEESIARSAAADGGIAKVAAAPVVDPLAGAVVLKSADFPEGTDLSQRPVDGS